MAGEHTVNGKLDRALNGHLGLVVLAIVVLLLGGVILAGVAVSSIKATERHVGSLPALVDRVGELSTRIDRIAEVVPHAQLTAGRLSDLKIVLERMDGRVEVVEDLARAERALRAARKELEQRDSAAPGAR